MKTNIFDTLGTLEFLNKQLLALPIQFFAEPTPGEPTPGEPPTPSGEPTPPEPPTPGEPPEPPAKTYTQEQLEAMIQQRVISEKKAAKKAIEEAEKLAKMNEEQKRQYEFEKLQKDLEEYKRKDAYNTMSFEATKMLADHDIVADPTLLSFVVKETADETKETVNAFVELINAKVQEGIKKSLAGTPPKRGTNQGAPGALTREEIMKEKDHMKRQRLISENMQLFE